MPPIRLHDAERDARIRQRTRRPAAISVAEAMAWTLLQGKERRCQSWWSGYGDSDADNAWSNTEAKTATYSGFQDILLDWEENANQIREGSAVALEGLRTALLFFKRRHVNKVVIPYRCPAPTFNASPVGEAFPYQLTDEGVDVLRPLLPYLAAVGLDLYEYYPHDKVGNYDWQGRIENDVEKARRLGVPVVGILWDHLHPNANPPEATYGYKFVSNADWEETIGWLIDAGVDSIMWWGNATYFLTDADYLAVTKAEAAALGYSNDLDGATLYTNDQLVEKMTILRNRVAGILSAQVAAVPGPTTAPPGHPGIKGSLSADVLTPNGGGPVPPVVPPSPPPPTSTQGARPTCPDRPVSGTLTNNTGEYTLGAGATTLSSYEIFSADAGIHSENDVPVTTLSVTGSIITSSNYGIYLGDCDTLTLVNCIITAGPGGNDYGIRGSIGVVNISCSLIRNAGTNKACFRVYGCTDGLIQKSIFTGERMMIGGGGRGEAVNQIETSGLEFNDCDINCIEYRNVNGVITLGPGGITIYGETHHIDFVDCDFSGSGLITLWGMDGAVIEDPACHHITFTGCTRNGHALAFATDFSHPTYVAANAATQNVVIN